MLITSSPRTRSARIYQAEQSRLAVGCHWGTRWPAMMRPVRQWLEGLAGFTHLFNAMRPLQSRDPGPIAAALESPTAWYGLIVDGWHVSPAMLRLALRGCGHPMLVTDAMPPVGGRRSTFQLYGSEIKVVQGRCLKGRRHAGRRRARYGDRGPQLP